MTTIYLKAQDLKKNDIVWLKSGHLVLIDLIIVMPNGTQIKFFTRSGHSFFSDNLKEYRVLIKK